MDQAITQFKQTGQELQQFAQKFAEDAKGEVQNIKPIDAGIAFGVALLLSIGLHLSTKQKQDSVVTIGCIVYALIAGGLALLIKKKEIREQFPFMLTVFAFVRLFFDVSAISTIALSLSPALINITSAEVEKVIKKA